jgi:hypothetical protein
MGDVSRLWRYIATENEFVYVLDMRHILRYQENVRNVRCYMSCLNNATTCQYVSRYVDTHHQSSTTHTNENIQRDLVKFGMSMSTSVHNLGPV